MTEIRLVARHNPYATVGTVFFGGGTPSLLTPQQFERILKAVYTHFALDKNAELSLEANPNDLNHNYLSALRGLGFNRLSIGMQSAVDAELRLFHRRHDADSLFQVMADARSAGFNNVNLDLIYGAPHQSLEHWRTSVQRAIVLKPEHISLYALGLEDGTPLKSWVEAGHLPAPDDDLSADMYDLATDLLGQAGYEQYEISNWSKPGYTCRHNLQYWYNFPYAGLGPGAHGYAGGVRYANLLIPQKYIDLLRSDTGEHPFPLTPVTVDSVVVDQRNEISETLIMGLRLTQEGIQRQLFRERFGIDLVDLHRPIIEKYTKFGLLVVDDVRVRLTQRGRLLSNMVFRELV